MKTKSFFSNLYSQLQSSLGKRLPNIMPKRLFPRTLIIIAAPLVLLQSILAFVSMERHWQLVTTRLSEATAQDISALIAFKENQPATDQNRQIMINMAQNLGFRLDFPDHAGLPPQRPRQMFGILEDILRGELDHYIKHPYWIDTASSNGQVEIRIRQNAEIMRVFFRRNRAYASNTHIFIVWMVGSSVILLLIAVMFLRNQIRPILHLAEAAERFGKGLPLAKNFRPQGALEIRQASRAFLRMRDRIERHVDQRTTMLAGVSHDLRTILTRFKLELALSDKTPEIEAMRKDVDEMQGMVNAYMDFVKGEGDEETASTNIVDLLAEITNEMARSRKTIKRHAHSGDANLLLRRAAFKRAVTNLVNNATQYADKVELSSKIKENRLFIHVDDDGPGIAPERREEVFQPFVRLDDARTQHEGANTGLGLTIANDIVHSHGGRIILANSPLGGLRATIAIPL